MMSTIEFESIREIWNLPPILSSWSPPTGTVHHITLLQTVQDRYALRAYSYSREERQRIESEHAVAAYVQESGLPAMAPLLISTGDTICEYADRFFALFPFAPGHQIQRNALGLAHITTMGAFLALLHKNLQAYPLEHVSSFSFTIDHDTTLTRIEHIEQIIRSKRHLEEVDHLALTRLEQRRVWLKQSSPADVASLLSLEQQGIHGDYQESNLFFDDGRVSAIIDWDFACPAPRAWEVVRALHYLFGFEVAKSRAFVEAYRRVLPLSCAELQVTAGVYGWIREHDLWLYEELYLQNNQRVNSFVRPGNFVPIAHRWAPLSQVL